MLRVLLQFVKCLTFRLYAVGDMRPAMRLLMAAAAALLLMAPAAVRAETTVTTSNSSDDTDTTSGDSTASNSAAAQVGHNGGGETEVDAEDVTSQSATNVQEGDNDVDASQSARSESGASVGGQVIGAVTSGALTVDATNSSTDVDAESGDADATNGFAAFVGLDNASDTTIAADVTNGLATNVQEGDNAADVAQQTFAVTGDAVAGQVLGATTAGPTDIVLANTSDDADATSGDSTEDSESGVFSGLTATGVIDIA